MPTKTTTKTAARKTAPARKPVKAAAAESKRKETKSVKAEGPAKAKSNLTHAPSKPKSDTEAARKSHAAVARAESAAKPTQAAQPTEIAKPKPVMETVSLIDEKKPRPKRAEGDTAPKRTSFLPPISRIRPTPEPTPGPVATSPAPPSQPTAPVEIAEPVAAVTPAEPEAEPQKIIHIKPPIVVKDLAQQLGVKNFQLIKELMDDFQIFANPNLTVEPDIATQICQKHGFVFEMERREKGGGVHKVEQVVVAPPPPVIEKEEELKTRGPIITFMGHVDHGKTSLMDAIRKTRVAAGEAGGITQHIGAYTVDYKGTRITFLDTPGHAAFTAMRARGAHVTDIVVLVVAADDGVMPQTVEAIQHARAANVAMVVAVNKVDKGDADPDRVRNDLGKQNVIPEEWGGDTMFVNVSARTGQGIDQLLETILLQAEVLDLKAPQTGAAVGVVLESSIEKGRGAVATVLVKRGTMRAGDPMVAVQEFGRVRALFDATGKQVSEAGPAVPVQVLGLSDAPNAGDELLVVENERKAREVALHRQGKVRDVRLASAAKKSDDVFSQLGSEAAETVQLVVKADVQGSAEALRDALSQLGNDNVTVRVIASGVGGITESDVTLAIASRARIVGFNVRADAAARAALKDSGIDVRYYSIIYEAIDDVKLAIAGLVKPEIKEQIVGLAEVREVFRSSKFGTVAGCLVVEGYIKRGNPVRVLRDNVVIHQGELDSLRRFKDDVGEVRAGTECGIGVRNYNDIRVGDQIECFADRKSVV